MEWIFPNPEVAVEEELEDEIAEEVIATDTNGVEGNLAGNDSKNLTFWLQIEVLMFVANIISNMIYLFLRSCSRNRILFKMNGEKTNIEDADEENLLD